MEVLIYRYPYQLLLVSQRNSTKVQPIGKENQAEQLRERYRQITLTINCRRISQYGKHRKA